MNLEAAVPSLCAYHASQVVLFIDFDREKLHQPLTL